MRSGILIEDLSSGRIARVQSLVVGGGVELIYHTDSRPKLQASLSATELNDLGDVNAPSPADEDFLVYDTTGSEWRNRKLLLADIPQGGASTGDLLRWSGSAWAPSATLPDHEHAASDITSGTLDAARVGVTAVGGIPYSPDGSALSDLGAPGSSNVLLSTGPGWGKVTSSYTSGTFPPDSHSYDSHTGTVPLADLAGSPAEGQFLGDDGAAGWEARAITASDLPTHDIISKHTGSPGAAGKYIRSTGASAFSWATIDAADLPDHTHDANDWDAGTWTQYGIVYALTATSLTSTSAPGSGSMLYSTDGASWSPLSIGGSSEVLRSDGASPSWGKITSSYTTGTFPPDSHSYDSHTGTVPLSDLGGSPAAGQFVGDDGAAGWEARAIAEGDLPTHDIVSTHDASGLTIGHFFKADSATTFSFQAHGLTYSDVGAAAASHTHDADDWSAGTWTQYGVVYATSATALTTTSAATTGDLLYSPDGTSWAPFAVGTSGQVLRGGTTPTWGAVPSHEHVASDITSGVFGVARGGTGLSSWTAAGRLIYSTGATALTTLAHPGATKFLQASGTSTIAWDDVAWGDVTGKPSTFPPEAHTHDGDDWDAGTWTQYGIVYALSATSLTTTASASTGAIIWSMDGASWTVLAPTAGVKRVLLANNQSLSWGQLDSTYTTGTFPPESHSYDSHTGTVPLSDLGGSPAAGQFLGDDGAASWQARAITASDLPSHEHAAGDITSGVLAIGRGGTNRGSGYTTGQFLEYDGTQISSSGYSESSFAAASHTHDANDWDAATWTQYGVVYATSATALTTTSAATTGDLLYSPDGTSWAGLAVGTSGQVLKGGATPTWGTVSWGEVTGKPSEFPPEAHALESAGGYHTASGLTIGWVLRATGTTSFAFGALQSGDLPSHSHSAGDITSGVLAIARGGTNNASYTDGEFLEWDSVAGKIQSSGYDQSDFAAASHEHAASDVTSGTFAAARIGVSATGGIPYSPDGSALGDLGAPGSNNVLLSTGPGWAKLTASYTTGTFPPDSHSLDSHSGSLSLSKLGGVSPQTIIRSNTAGTGWETVSGSLGQFLRMIADGTNDIASWVTLTAAMVDAGTFPTGTFTIPGTLIVGTDPGGSEALRLSDGLRAEGTSYIEDVKFTSGALQSHDVALSYVSIRGATNTAYFRGQRCNNTISSPTAVANGDWLTALQGGGYDGSTWQGARSYIALSASQAWTGSAHGAQILFYTTPNDSTTPELQWQILHSGNLQPYNDVDVSIGASTKRVGGVYSTHYYSWHTIPVFYWYQSDGATDEKNWNAVVDGTQWRLRGTSDDWGTTVDYIKLTRSGTAISWIGLYGPTFVDGNYLRVQNGYFHIDRAGDSATVAAYMDRDAGYQAQLYFRTGNSNRWVFTVTNAAESDPQTGSNCRLDRHNNAGAYLNSPVSIERATGDITLCGGAGQLIIGSDPGGSEALRVTGAGRFSSSLRWGGGSAISSSDNVVVNPMTAELEIRRAGNAIGLELREHTEIGGTYPDGAYYDSPELRFTASYDSQAGVGGTRAEVYADIWLDYTGGEASKDSRLAFEVDGSVVMYLHDDPMVELPDGVDLKLGGLTWSPKHDKGDSGDSTVTVNFWDGNEQYVNLTNTSSIAINIANEQPGTVVVLTIRRGSGSGAVTWDSQIDWGNVGAPTIPTSAGDAIEVTLHCHSTTETTGSWNQRTYTLADI